MATFRKLPSGKWQARVSNQGKEFSVGTFRTKKEAEIEAAKVEEKIYYGQSLIDRNILFREVVEEWTKYKRNSVKESTFENIDRYTRLHILPYFKDMKISRMTRGDINNWLQEYANAKNEDGTEKFSYNSRKNYLATLKNIFYYATNEMEVITKDPSLKIQLPTQDNVEALKENTKYYTLEELNKLLSFMRQYKHRNYGDYQLYYMLMYLLSHTGLRISEALALRWTDLNDNKLTIERQTRRDDKNQLKITSLKNTSSYRTITLDDDLLKELKKFKIKQNELILKEKTFRRNKDNIIFQNHIGNYLINTTVREMFKRYCKMAGVDYKGTHSFRHTHSVLLLESGANIKYVSKRLGHKSIKTTADIYLDVTDKIEKNELSKFANYTKTENSSRHEIGMSKLEVHQK